MVLANYKGANSGRGPSPAIWGDLPPDIVWDPNKGIHFFDDFLDASLPGTQTTQIAWGRYKVYNTGTGGAKVIPHSGFPTTGAYGGFLRALADTAGDQFALGTQAIPFLLNNTAGKLRFEARIGITGIATNNLHLFVGLGENIAMTYGAAQPLADADATQTTGGLIGFNILEDGVGVLNTAYADRAAVWTQAQAGVGTMVAHTWKKVGMIYDPNSTLEALTFYVDGVKQTGVVTAAALAALTYLDVNGLGLCFAGFADSAGTSTYAYLDWWRCAQEAA